MVGDGYCNSETNNLHCAFDWGDCCYSELLITDFCPEDEMEDAEVKVTVGEQEGELSEEKNEEISLRG